MNIEKKKKILKIGNMSCVNPIPALVFPPDPITGKKKVKLLRSGSYLNYDYPSLKQKYGDLFVELPCGHCPACIEQRTRSWAIRCTMEAAQYEKNSFITLTYNDSCLPFKGVSKQDIFKFIKRLRNKFGAGIRYYGCAEYGSSLNTERAHYHLILFGFFPDDAEFIKYDAFGGCYYSSKVLQELWSVKGKDGKKHSLGFVSVGDVTYNSCAYVARYCQKKLKRDLGIANKNPEFSFMSRRPGIGEVYFRHHFKSLMETDRIYFPINDSLSFSSFRYFDKLIEKIDPDRLLELKSQRISNGEVSVASELLKRNLSSMEHYLLSMESEYSEKFNKLKRRVL